MPRTFIKTSRHVAAHPDDDDDDAAPTKATAPTPKGGNRRGIPPGWIRGERCFGGPAAGTRRTARGTSPARRWRGGILASIEKLFFFASFFREDDDASTVIYDTRRGSVAPLSKFKIYNQQQQQ